MMKLIGAFMTVVLPHGYTASGRFCVPSQGAQDVIELPLNGSAARLDPQRLTLSAQRQWPLRLSGHLCA